MTVRVRLFAALREAAATPATSVDATTLSGALAELRDRYGELFSRRLAVASVLIDGRPVSTQADVSLDEVDELVLLPPFSGGCG